MRKQISSTQNQQIKELLQLKEKSRNRRKTGRFLIEGLREIQLAISGNIELVSLLYCPDTIDNKLFESLLGSLDTEPELIEITIPVYEKLAHRGSTEGIIAVAKSKSFAIDQLTFSSESPLILVAESPEKPGNIGALLRTADAAGIDAVLIADPKTDCYNPNIIRSSVGTVFTQQVAEGSSSEILNFLRENNITIYGAALSATQSYDAVNYNKAVAIVMGTEARGLTPFWLQNTDSNILIPMHGKIDSLNVSVSAAVVVFEAVRQRNTTKT